MREKIFFLDFPRKILKMKEGYVEVNTVPTHIFTWGQWIEDDFDEGTKEIVLMVTGNPGLGGFYTQFCSTIHDELDNKIPVWVIGHAGKSRHRKILCSVIISRFFSRSR